MRSLIPLLGLITLASAFAQAQDASAALDAVMDNLRGGSLEATLILRVERPDRSTQYVMAFVSDGEERALVRVLEPPRDAGQAYLTVGENLWIYNPRLKRTLRLPPSGRNDRFLGSDLSYSDLAGRDLERHYTVTLAENGSELVFTLSPKPGAPTPFGRVVVTAEAERRVPKEVVYHDQRGNPVKRIVFSGVVEAQALFFPTRIEVIDLTREGYRTTLEMRDLRLGVEIPEACFRPEALERGCL